MTIVGVKFNYFKLIVTAGLAQLIAYLALSLVDQQLVKTYILIFMVIFYANILSSLVANMFGMASSRIEITETHVKIYDGVWIMPAVFKREDLIYFKIEKFSKGNNLGTISAILNNGTKEFVGKMNLTSYYSLVEVLKKDSVYKMV